MKVLQGTIHQGNNLIFPVYYGVQCCSASVVACAYGLIHDPNLWTASDIDACVHLGTNLHAKSCPQTHNGFLFPHEIHETFTLPNNVDVSLQAAKEAKFIGPIHNIEGFGDEIVSALTTYFQTSRCGILTCNEYSFAILSADKYWMFDSHAKNMEGKCDNEGFAVLISFISINELVQYLQQNFNNFSTYSITEIKFDMQIPVFDLLGDSNQNQPGLPVSNHIGDSNQNQPGLPVFDHLGDSTQNQPGLPVFDHLGDSNQNQPGLPVFDRLGDSNQNQPGLPVFDRLGDSNQNQPGLPVFDRLGDSNQNQPGLPVSNHIGDSNENQPEVLQGLTQLEERLLAVRQPFMKIIELSKYAGPQYGLKGSCVNVPTELNSTVSILPRNLTDSETILIKLQRRMKDKVPYSYDLIRPERVYKAAKFLVETEIYKKHNITLDSDWLHNVQSPIEVITVNNEDNLTEDFNSLENDLTHSMDENIQTMKSQPNLPHIKSIQKPKPKKFEDIFFDTDSNASSSSNESSDSETETGNHETMVMPDILPDHITNDLGLKIAPGEGQVPISLLQDEDVDILTYPSIYCGEEDIENCLSHDEDNEPYENNSDWIPLRNNAGYIKLRSKPKIIRFRNYNLIDDEYNYFREQVMLYHPWHNEQNIINDAKGIYETNVTTININKKKYNFNMSIDLDKMMEEINTHNEEYNSDDEAQDICVSDDFKILELGTVDSDIALEIPTMKTDDDTPKFGTFTVPKAISNQEYIDLLSSLNEKQTKYHDNFLNLIKSNTKEQFFHFISGPGGVGKSTLLNAITHTATRFWSHQIGNDPADVHIILSAPTGKAAFNIQGQTIHSIFGLDFDLKKELKTKMSANKRNTLMYKLKKLKILVIDEISMVSYDMMEVINLRLQQIFENNLPFGSVSLICLGDFNQLPPIYSTPVYQPSKDTMSILSNASNEITVIHSEHGSNETFYMSKLWSLFELYELTQFMRQKNDLKFAEALLRFANGKTTDEDDAMFESRQLSTLNIPEDITIPDATAIALKNITVDNYNATCLSKDFSEGCDSPAIDITPLENIIEKPIVPNGEE
ncbi:ATP-dependent DNA helicase [Frankliniella fusca]|uniref:ATP-dependent DNA helicase n=1 Tax=Frankliniella fusca TaxID=407009 RepID=A0AAE1HHL0_9NEOP|nr:ATP-dependent DNA helicase [Frankliniella fusca]